ncbi:hypothetical protein AGLY_010112 [Aphis glycines]|uniref:Uncharacterized protein n=1 Tax=Aphis glycines TaxID=307491 RepID=A0A6G0THA7_APHGL|nr:hypothetical protein AGLY_010112 [Aphis glycines]
MTSCYSKQRDERNNVNQTGNGQVSNGNGVRSINQITAVTEEFIKWITVAHTWAAKTKLVVFSSSVRHPVVFRKKIHTLDKVDPLLAVTVVSFVVTYYPHFRSVTIGQYNEFNEFKLFIGVVFFRDLYFVNHKIVFKTIVSYLTPTPLPRINQIFTYMQDLKINVLVYSGRVVLEWDVSIKPQMRVKKYSQLLFNEFELHGCTGLDKAIPSAAVLLD